MKQILLIIVLLMVPISVLAQDDGVFEHPDGLFVVTAPEGWTDTSTEEMAHFVTEAVDIYVLAVPTTALESGLDEALALLAPDVSGDPVQVSDAPLSNGVWQQRIYLVGSDLVVVAGRVHAEATIVFFARGTQADLTAVNSMLVAVLQGIQFPALGSPDYADPAAFTEQAVMVDTLPGTLSMPMGDGPFPAVVIVHGSGPGDRDGTLYDLKPYRDLAWGLASRGIAVLRYDKRTRVHPEEFADPTFTVDEEVIDDVHAAVELLRDTDSIDPNRVFVLGHSLGGMLAPRIAEGDEDIAGLIIMAGNARPLHELILEQTYYLAEYDGDISPVDAQQIEAIEQTVAQIEMLAEGDEMGYLLGAPPIYWLDLRGYDPVAMAQSLEIPMLILQGERDYQVTMEDFALWQAGLSDRDNVTFISYPTLNHNMMPGEGTPSPEEYEALNFVDVAVIEDIAGWIN